MVKVSNKKYPWIIITLFAIDQITKYLVLKSNKIIDFGIFLISEVHNTGASFGILQGSNIALAFLSAIVILIIGKYFKKLSIKNKIPLSMVSAGILGNLTDRITQGHVIDFIDFRWWPVFNFADVCIVIGVIWLGINLLREENKTNSKK